MDTRHLACAVRDAAWLQMMYPFAKGFEDMGFWIDSGAAHFELKAEKAQDEESWKDAMSGLFVSLGIKAWCKA